MMYHNGWNDLVSCFIFHDGLDLYLLKRAVIEHRWHQFCQMTRPSMYRAKFLNALPREIDIQVLDGKDCIRDSSRLSCLQER